MTDVERRPWLLAPRRRGTGSTGRPLRVLFVVPSLRVGGAEHHAATLMAHLDPTRFVPHLLSIGERGRYFDETVAAGIPARALHRSRRGLGLALIQMIRHMRRVRPDVVVTNGANAEALGRIAATVARVPRTVVWVHNCGDITPRGRVRRLSDRLLEPLTSAYFGVAHGQVPYMVDDLGYPRSKIRIIQNGVDPARFGTGEEAGRDPVLAAELDVPLDAPVVGVIAVLRPEKDHETFLRAVRLTLEREPRAYFLIVGDGECRAELTALAADLGVADRVRFTGMRSDVGALLRFMDVFVLTSYTVECFPMALLEAMGAGRPAVCTAVGGVPEMIVEGVTGHLVPVRDPAAVAARLSDLLGDPERARSMGEAARGRLHEEFTLRRSVQRAESAFVDTVAEVRPTSCNAGPRPVDQ